HPPGVPTGVVHDDIVLLDRHDSGPPPSPLREGQHGGAGIKGEVRGDRDAGGRDRKAIPSEWGEVQRYHLRKKEHQHTSECYPTPYLADVWGDDLRQAQHNEGRRQQPQGPRPRTHAHGRLPEEITGIIAAVTGSVKLPLAGRICAVPRSVRRRPVVAL